MHIEQIPVGRMANFCYRIEDAGDCALIDPAFDTDTILAAVSTKNLRVSCIINTHGHPDHTAGNAAVAAATGAPLLIHEADAHRVGKVLHKAFSRILGGRGSPGADRVLREGDTITVGDTRLAVLHTPGHTPGSICLFLPGHLFTGDTLFAGAVGRTDLPGGSAKTLRQSIIEKLYRLPDDTRVWPGHDYGPTPWTTIGRERETNPFTR